MKISDEQVQKVLEGATASLTGQAADVEELIRQNDAELIAELTQKVMTLGDREDMVERVRKAIAEGTYNPTGDEIAEGMIRRAIADKIR